MFYQEPLPPINPPETVWNSHRLGWLGLATFEGFGSRTLQKLAKEFEDRDAVLMAGSSDNEFCKLAWRREHKDLRGLNHWQFADTTGSLVDQLGVREKSAGVALRATFIVDPDNTIQHVTVNNLNVGRSPQETLRILDGLQTDELCPCNREIGGQTLK